MVAFVVVMDGEGEAAVGNQTISWWPRHLDRFVRVLVSLERFSSDVSYENNWRSTGRRRSIKQAAITDLTFYYPRRSERKREHDYWEGKLVYFPTIDFSLEQEAVLNNFILETMSLLECWALQRENGLGGNSYCGIIASPSTRMLILLLGGKGERETTNRKIGGKGTHAPETKEEEVSCWKTMRRRI